MMHRPNEDVKNTLICHKANLAKTSCIQNHGMRTKRTRSNVMQVHIIFNFRSPRAVSYTTRAKNRTINKAIEAGNLTERNLLRL